ncbi:hypothetical protein J6590_021660 [Homalodisca vitripennis]|nr:hypothetical protein J6590_021660 [Homalodisca vitripennis]
MAVGDHLSAVLQGGGVTGGHGSTARAEFTMGILDAPGIWATRRVVSSNWWASDRRRAHAHTRDPVSSILYQPLPNTLMQENPSCWVGFPPAAPFLIDHAFTSEYSSLHLASKNISDKKQYRTIILDTFHSSLLSLP